MEPRLALQFGQALEQVVDEANEALVAVALRWPIVDREHGRYAHRLHRSALWYEIWIVGCLELGGQIVLFQLLGQRNGKKLEPLRPLPAHKGFDRLPGHENYPPL